jgi:flavin-dependent dehydrogenase
MLDLDVAVIGGGLAGTLLARQIHRTRPGTRIALFERATETSYKVGESTVEVASDYLIRRHDLSTYLYEEQLPKNGLRFFFDTEERNAPIDEMSEMGTEFLPKVPSFQLDRARLEADLRQMNTAAGIPQHIGYAVRDLVLGDANTLHRFKAVSPDETIDVSARWVMDCSGRGNVISKQKSLKLPTAAHQITAAWGRFRGVANMDAHPNHEWRRRVRFGPRYLSTNHFCYPGYWIWFIPLNRGVVSVGVVIEREQYGDEYRGEEGFMRFLREHRAPRELLESAEIMDYGAYKQLSYANKSFFSADRWAVVGEAGAFTDPFYSPGSDFIAMEADYATDLFVREMAGEDAASRETRRVAYDRFIQERFELTMTLYEHQYPLFGSYNAMRIKLPFELASYYNLCVRPYMLDNHLNLEWLAKANAKHPQIMSEFKELEGLFAELGADLKQRGLYYSRNLGQYRVGFDQVVPFALEMGSNVPEATVDAHQELIASVARKQALRLLKRTAPDATSSAADEVQLAE